MIRQVAICGLTLALAGCFQNEAGQGIDSGSFGNATLNNAAIQSGDKSYAIQLGERFAAEVPSTVNFAFDSAVLDEPARQALDLQANWIRQFPEIRFRVYGHTDSVGSASYNKSLGLRRARAVVSYLGARGISRSRLEAVASFGETQPVIVTPNRERRNRRTVTEVNGFVENHPSLLDGKYAQVVYREYLKSAEPIATLSEDQGFATEQ
ncbi:MAG: OmpA family protein [Paracoccaceae bacterium]|jgi:outer membrane protein OmpA-like peptidoglycan-associated protein